MLVLAFIAGLVVAAFGVHYWLNFVQPSYLEHIVAVRTPSLPTCKEAFDTAVAGLFYATHVITSFNWGKC
jgi:hypothetical protein